jgi:hypothetical protein
MSQQPARGINRQVVDAAFEADESRKSNLILAARLLREQTEDEAASRKFAEAAELEERLGERCTAQGLREKAWVHRFSAASCWAQAGNFYQSLSMCDDLLADADLPDRLRQRIQDYGDTLRARRAQWYAGLALEATGSET